MNESGKNARIIRYNQRAMKQIKINLNRNNPDDTEIIDFLEQQPNVQGLIKNLIREYMKK